ncbi:MAG: sugar transferase [Phycisphaerae bacterium]|jgi:lipopolysaccharide/colanic/teichoic acid biosynthesis glycosyltransferase
MAKRLFDIVFSLLGLAVVGLPMLVIAAVIKLTDPGPVLYRQVRVGKNGREFRILKFRTMVVNAERIGAQITVGGDPRITPIGRFLRRTKLDEFPQLLNVLGGSMSFVGPRPEVPKYVALYTPQQRAVLSVKPGITDLASIQYHRESDILAQAGADWEKAYVEQVMPDKLRLNLEYLQQRRSLLSDVAIILKTLLRISS